VLSKFGVKIAKNVPKLTLIFVVKTMMEQVIKNTDTLEFKFEIQ
jgi:hypothetical protein